jgi:hypothetical protein
MMISGINVWNWNGAPPDVKRLFDEKFEPAIKERIRVVAGIETEKIVKKMTSELLESFSKKIKEKFDDLS